MFQKRVTDPGATVQPPMTAATTASNEVTGPAALELQVAEARMAQLDDEIAQAQADQRALDVRRQSAEAAVAKFTEQAAAGTLKDLSRLAQALRHQRELANNGITVSAGQLQSELAALQQRTHELRRRAATEVYLKALDSYVKACAPLPALARRVHEAAAAAGVPIFPHNSPGLLGRQILIGDALLDIPTGAA